MDHKRKLSFVNEVTDLEADCDKEKLEVIDNDTLQSSDFLTDSDEENESQERELKVVQSRKDREEVMEIDTGGTKHALPNASGSGISYFEPQYFATSSFVEAIVPVLISQNKQRFFMLLKFHLNENLVVDITFYILFAEWLYFPLQIATIRVNLWEYFMQNGLASTNRVEFEYDKNCKAVFRQKNGPSTREEYKEHIAQMEVSGSVCKEGFPKLQACVKQFDRGAGFPDKVFNKCPVICSIPPKLRPRSLKKFALSDTMPFPNIGPVECAVYMVSFPTSSLQDTEQTDNCKKSQQCLSQVPEIEGDNHPELFSRESTRKETSNQSNNDDQGQDHTVVPVENSSINVSSDIQLEQDPSLEKIVNIPGQGSVGRKRHKKRLLDHNRALRISFCNSILTGFKNEEPPVKSNPMTVSENGTKHKKRNAKVTKPTEYDDFSVLSQNILQSESGEEFVKDEHLGPQRQFKDDIAPFPNLAVSNNSNDSIENDPDDYIPPEIRRCDDLPQNLTPDSAYGTQSKQTLDGMNEYHETYVQARNQNHGNLQTEQTRSMKLLPENSDRKFYSEIENETNQSVDSGHTQNVLQIDPLFAKVLGNCGIPFTNIILKFPSNEARQGSQRDDGRTRPPGLIFELELPAGIKKLDEEFKELHPSSSRETSGQGNNRPQVATHIITVEPDCYQNLFKVSGTLRNKGLFQPPYARTVTAGDTSYLVDYLLRLKNNSLENHCGLVFRNKMIQSLVNKKGEFRINYEYEVLKKLGSGGHGSAYLSVCKGGEGGKPFVVKKCPRSNFNEEEIKVPFRYGNAYTRMLDVYGIVLEGEEVSVIMEYAKGGTLKTHRNFPEKNVQFLVAVLHRLLKILQELHLLGIFHFDIKEENIVFTHKGDPYSATLLDWGSTKCANQANQNYNNGTKRFYPPEMITGRNEGEMDLGQHDIWTLACAILSNLNGHFVFGDLWESCDRGQRKEDYKQSLLNGRVISDELVKDNLPASRLLLHLKDLLMWMLDPDVRSRASVLEASHHPVFDCCMYETSTWNDLERSTEWRMNNMSPSHTRQTVRVLIHHKNKVLYTTRVRKGYPVKRLMDNTEFKTRVDLGISRQKIVAPHGYCLLKNNRNVFTIDDNCYLELRPA